MACGLHAQQAMDVMLKLIIEVDGPDSCPLDICCDVRPFGLTCVADGRVPRCRVLVGNCCTIHSCCTLWW